MGKTRSTYRQKLEEFDDEWSRFQRSLIKEEQPHWDSLITQARNHAHAGHNQAPFDSKWGIVFSILLAQEKRIAELEDELDKGS